jgi:hypothetical protein
VRDHYLLGRIGQSTISSERQLLAYSVEKLRFASGAKIHEEFNSVLRAITGTG